MRTIGAKNKPKTFNVSLGQLKKILNFENDSTVLEVSIKYLPLLGLTETQIISNASTIVQNKTTEKPIEPAAPIDLSEY